MNLLFRTSHGCLACRERKKRTKPAMDGVLSIVAINNNTSLVPLRKRSPSNKSHVLIVHLAIPFSMRQIFNKKKKKNSTFNFCPNTNSRSLNGALFLKKCSKMFQNVNRQLPQLSLIKIRQESSPRKNRFSCRVKYFKVAHNCREKGGK